MGQVQRFEDLIAWQKARVLARDVYAATQTGAFANDFGLSGQNQRAAVSIGSNVAEGFERCSRPGFVRFLTIAKSSCAEVRSQLYLALDIGYLDQGQFESLYGQSAEVGRIIGGLRNAVSKPRKKPDSEV
jgi:four helix bundle protein